MAYKTFSDVVLQYRNFRVLKSAHISVMNNISTAIHQLYFMQQGYHSGKGRKAFQKQKDGSRKTSYYG